jgi:thiamine biosynthesis protein ThiS
VVDAGGCRRSVTTETITLILNGQPRQAAGHPSLSELLDELGIDRRTIAIAYNEDVVPRDRYAEVVLQDGDRVEVVRMVGGG